MTQVIGLMSGTSVDGIDAVLVELQGTETNLQHRLLAAQTYAYPPALRDQILAVCAGQALSIPELALLDDAIATCFAEAAIAINQGYHADLIGSHGQTVYHRPPHPDHPLGYTLQLGRGSLIHQLTQIPTVSNFRVADINVHGQGAPLVSRIDVALLGHPEKSSCVQNIGGIANVTYLPADPINHLDAVQGWDTGPGNCLMDMAVAEFTQGEQLYDQDGAWAASGTANRRLVELWLCDPFFVEAPPKSTGREYFSPDFLRGCLQEAQGHSPADILASLSEFTAASIALSYQHFLPQLPDRVLLCGGGSRNPDLRQRLQRRLPTVPVLTTDEVGLNSQFKEAITFAVLAYWRTLEIPGNLPSVTGAHQPMLLGEIFPDSQTLKLCSDLS